MNPMTQFALALILTVILLKFLSLKRPEPKDRATSLKKVMVDLDIIHSITVCNPFGELFIAEKDESGQFKVRAISNPEFVMVQPKNIDVLMTSIQQMVEQMGCTLKIDGKPVKNGSKVIFRMKRKETPDENNN